MLTSPLTLRNGRTLRNRAFKAAMSEGLAQRHAPSDAMIRLYQRWGDGGLGALITGNIQVDRNHLERAGNLVLDERQGPEGMDRYRRLAGAAQRQGAALIAQLSHTGRVTAAAINPTPLAPSAVQLRLPGLTLGVPLAMTVADIRQVVGQFAAASRLARDAGFAGVEIHAAHGYLLSQFLSPLANVRGDDWGGALENRARLLGEVVRVVRSEAGSGLAVGVKLNATDFRKGAFSLADAVQVARWLDDDAVDFLEITGGTHERLAMASSHRREALGHGDTEVMPDSAATGEAFFLEYAAAIRRAVRCPVAVTGGFRSRVAMEQALASGAADLIGIGRPLCVSPTCGRDLLAGTIDTLPDAERRLALTRFPFLGPASPLRLVRRLNTWGALNWFSLQIRRLAEGHGSDLALSPWSALRQYAAWEREALRDRATIVQARDSR